jgi:hypothetical protein
MPKDCSLVKQDFWDPKITQVYNLVFKVIFITLGTKFAIVYMEVVVNFSHVHTRLMISVMLMGFFLLVGFA